MMMFFVGDPRVFDPHWWLTVTKKHAMVIHCLYYIYYIYILLLLYTNYYMTYILFGLYITCYYMAIYYTSNVLDLMPNGILFFLLASQWCQWYFLPDTVETPKTPQFRCWIERLKTSACGWTFHEPPCPYGCHLSLGHPWCFSDYI